MAHSRFIRKILLNFILIGVMMFLTVSFLKVMIDSNDVKSTTQAFYSDVINYVDASSVETSIIFGKKYFQPPENIKDSWKYSDDPIKDFFNGLAVVTGLCSKLHRVKGEVWCLKDLTNSVIDGEKVFIMRQKITL